MHWKALSDVGTGNEMVQIRVWHWATSAWSAKISDATRVTAVSPPTTAFMSLCVPTSGNTFQ